MRSDVVVCGAGIIGVSVALHLQARGRSVLLVDRNGVGNETSYGNAGLIERCSVIPYHFPRHLLDILRYSLNRATDVRFHWRFLPRIAPWLFDFWRHSSPAGLRAATLAMLPLVENSILEHQPLMAAANTQHLVRDTGWIEGYRTERQWDRAVAKLETLRDYGLRHELLQGAALRAAEPALSDRLVGLVGWQDPWTVIDPGALTRAYADLFLARGGRMVAGDARTLARSGEDWTLQADGPGGKPGGTGQIAARQIVLALGPWSADRLRPLGYRVPLAVKRGYHRHYQIEGGASLSRPLVDAAHGFALAPMAQGLRLTTGVEFADRDAPPSPVQLRQAEIRARELMALGRPIEPQPWMGSRPCLPDMRPVIGPAPRHPGLWLAFGHAHHGLTLGPVTGRILADMMTGADPGIDPAPYRLDRF